MSDAQPKGYKLTKFNLIMMDDGDNTTMTDDISPEKGSVLDIRNICSGWRYFESIDVPSLRMEFAILDTKDIISGMTGNELIEIEIESDCSPGLPLSITQRIFKIGAVTKSERAQAYVLFTVSPEMMNNESNKVFKVFRENSGYPLFSLNTLNTLLLSLFIISGDTVKRTYACALSDLVTAPILKIL